MSGAKIIPIDGADSTPPRRKPATKKAASSRSRTAKNPPPETPDLQATVDAETAPPALWSATSNAWWRAVWRSCVVG